MNPCIDYCFNRFGKEYTKDCDNNCEYAKVIVENKKLQVDLARMTNADHIRAMSDEELALQFGANCPKENQRACDRACSKCWLEWLQQPAKEGT